MESGRKFSCFLLLTVNKYFVTIRSEQCLIRFLSHHIQVMYRSFARSSSSYRKIMKEIFWSSTNLTIKIISSYVTQQWASTSWFCFNGVASCSVKFDCKGLWEQGEWREIASAVPLARLKSFFILITWSEIFCTWFNVWNSQVSHVFCHLMEFSSLINSPTSRLCLINFIIFLTNCPTLWRCEEKVLQKLLILIWITISDR